MKESFGFDVKQPVEQVFEALTDLDRLVVLSGGTLKLDAVLDRPRHGRGSAVLLKAPEGGLAVGDILCETLEWDPPRRCVRRFAIKDLPATVSLSFAEAGAGTRVAVELALEPQSLLYTMMLPGLALKLRSDKDKLLAQLQIELDKRAG